MVARKGSAPLTSGCRPDVILFHHRAKIGCLAWIRTKTSGVKARHAAVTLRGKELVEPEVVATSPYRIKSPVPVCCGFSSTKMVLAAGFAPALATLSTSCLFCWTTRAKEMDPPAGAAPAGFLYKRNPQAAAWRRKWPAEPKLNERRMVAVSGAAPDTAGL